MIHHSGGVIRLDKSGPYIHENTTHANVGIRYVTIDGRDLEIRHGLPGTGAKIVSINVTPDETIAGLKGIICGPSGGGGRTRIRFYSTKLNRTLNLSNSSDYDLVSGSLANIWVHFVHLCDD